MAKQAYTYQAADDLIRKWLGAGEQSATSQNTKTPKYAPSSSTKIPRSAERIISKILSVAKYNFGITDRERLTALLVVAGGETQFNATVTENFNYSLASAKNTFSKLRSLSDSDALKYIPTSKGGTGTQEKLANFLYKGMYGNISPNDGWKYRGRGLSQVTFKSNFQNVQNQIIAKSFQGLNIVTNPEILTSNEDVNVWVLVEGKIKGLFGKKLIPNNKVYLTDAITIQQTQNGGSYSFTSVTHNYIDTLSAINSTPWVQDLIKNI